jgi:methionine-gamma-lyase
MGYSTKLFYQETFIIPEYHCDSLPEEVFMSQYNPHHGIGTQAIHAREGDNVLNSHLSPIYQTAAFSFQDVACGAATFKGERPGYIYTRYDNPNLTQLADKLAILEGLDLLRARPETPPEEVVDGLVFSSGMAAITGAILARVKGGGTIIAQEALYGGTYTFLHDIITQYGIEVIFLSDASADAWEEAFRKHPKASLAFAETPANPTMAIVDLAAVAEIAHRHHAWLMVDNTFATPYCQRPLSLGTDVVIHSTTKYLSGHGQMTGGAVVSTQLDYMHKDLFTMLKILGGNASPFDAWLANIGLKTFEIRMQRHCENASRLALHLASHPKVNTVFYPGLESHPDHSVAQRQMLRFGGMLAIELKDGLQAGISMMDHLKLATMVPTLGTVDTIVQHPASMSHAGVPKETRVKVGITDGLVRISVGIENIEDILADMDQALEY